VRLHATGSAVGVERTLIGRIATDSSNAEASWLWWNASSPPGDVSDCLGVITPQTADDWRLPVPLVHSVQQLDYLASGDVIAADPNGFVRTLYRKASPHNFILMTEQCNSYCLMCSQPPKPIDDFDRLQEHLRLIDLIDPETGELGITGGEPTLFKDGFLELIRHCKERLPRTALHVLTNGRLFYYRSFAEKLGAIAHPDLVLGIPLYSDVDSGHDHVVQAKGAFEQTALGLLHLDRYDVSVEIRVVVHRLTYRRLARLAELIVRNFPFACHVALMGLEMFGFVHGNLEQLWIDPADYQEELFAATEILSLAGMNVSIYNHQLCVLDPRLWRFAKRSISDWKNVYLDECERCDVRAECGGFFVSGTKIRSRDIRAISRG